MTTHYLETFLVAAISIHKADFLVWKLMEMFSQPRQHASET